MPYVADVIGIYGFRILAACGWEHLGVPRGRDGIPEAINTSNRGDQEKRATVDDDLE